jgi:hypothetical protein
MEQLSLDDFEDSLRIFNSNGLPYCDLSDAEMLTYDAKKVPWRQLQYLLPARGGVLLTVERSMVVAVDGACRGNGTPNAKAIYGVYFGQ